MGPDQKRCLLFAKRIRFCLRLDFAYVIYAFLDTNRLIKQDHHWDYGEDRYQMLGQIDGRLFFVTYTVRSSVIRIISARKANQREVKEYEDNSREA